MASDAKSTKETTKAEPPPKKEATPAKAAEATSAKATDAAPANYSRGEGQKPVTQVYKDNWNRIFAPTKTAAKKARKKTR